MKRNDTATSDNFVGSSNRSALQKRNGLLLFLWKLHKAEEEQNGRCQLYCRNIEYINPSRVSNFLLDSSVPSSRGNARDSRVSTFLVDLETDVDEFFREKKKKERNKKTERESYVCYKFMHVC